MVNPRMSDAFFHEPFHDGAGFGVVGIARKCVRKKEKLQHEKNDGELYEDEYPQLPANSHSAETVAVEPPYGHAFRAEVFYRIHC